MNLKNDEQDSKHHPVLDRIDCFILGFAAASLIAIVLMLLILEEELHKRTFFLPSAIGTPMPPGYYPLHEVPKQPMYKEERENA